jgi:heavy-metal resistance protein CzcE
MKRSIRNIAFLATFAGSLVAAPSFAVTKADLSGSPAPSAAATRTVRVDPGIRSVNVSYGETVNLVVRDAGEEKTFTWRFDGTQNRLPLSDIVPVAASPVVIYVDQSNNPLNDRY